MPAAIIAGIVTKLIEPVTDLIGKFVLDKDKAAQLAYEISTLAATQAHENALAQLKVNEKEAESGKFFCMWRPFTGWTCAMAMGCNYMFFPLISYAGRALGSDIEPLPVLDLDVMLPVLMGMLGLGYLRTDEKKAGVAKDRL